MKTMKHLSKRGLALILALMMCFTMLPMQAFAAEPTELTHYDKQTVVDGVIHAANSPVESADKNVIIDKTAKRTGADTWEVTMTVGVNKNAIQPLPMDLVLLIDTSGSMKWCTDSHSHTDTCGISCGLEEHEHAWRNGCYTWKKNEWKLTCNKEEHTHEGSCYGNSRWAAAKAKAIELVNTLSRTNLNVRISVVTFAGNEVIDKNKPASGFKSLTTEKDAIVNYINNSLAAPGGGTDMAGGIDAARLQFSSTLEGTQKVLVMLADGDWGYSGASDRGDYTNPSNAATTIKDNTNKVEVYTVGFADGADAESTLKGIASTPTETHYYPATSSTELGKAFEQIAAKLTAMVNDDMGANVTVGSQVEITGGESVDPVDGKVSWTPKDGEIKPNQTTIIKYRVKAKPESFQNAGANQTIKLNGEAVLTYKVGDNATEQTLNFPLPTDTVDVYTLTEKWVEVGGTVDLQDPVTTKKIYWDKASDNGNFAVAQPDATINSNLNYQYSVVDSSANGTKLTNGTTVTNDGQNHTIIHYYSAQHVDPPEDTTGNTVTYQFVSNDSTALPAGVTEQLKQPDDGTYKVNASVENQLKSTEYTPVTETLADYSTRTWTFTSWDAYSKLMAKGGITFTGTWTHIDTPHEHKYDTTSVGHDGDGYVVTKPANCVDTGTKTRTCTVCNETETATIPVDPNNHKTPQTEFHDTCTTGCSQGSSDHHERICTSCTKVLESAPHSYTNEHKDASYTEAGYDKYTCNGCKHNYEVTIPQLRYGEGSYVIKWVDEDGNPLKENQNVTVDDIEGTSKEVTVNVGETTITKGDFTYTLDGRESLTGTVTAGAVATEFVFHFKRNNTHLSVTKALAEGQESTAKVGDTITYTITVKNEGAYKAVGVVVEEKPSDSLEILTVKKGEDIPLYNMVKGGYEVGNIEPQATVELTVTAKVVAAPEGTTIKNVAVASLENGDPTQGGTGTEPTDPENPGGDKGEVEVTYEKVTLTYDANGGTGNVPTQEPVDAGTEVTVADGNGLTREGYVFKGWSETKDGAVSTSYVPGHKVELTADTTLYAVWEKKATVITDPEKPGPKPVDPGDTIIVNPNGGTWNPVQGDKENWTSDDKVFTRKAKEGETITIPAPTWDDHNFLNWDVEEVRNTDGSKTITYTAKWNADSKPVTPTRAAYFVQHYQEQTDGTYAIVEKDTELLYGEIGKKVTATAKTYDGYAVDWNYSETVKEGTVFFTRPTANEDAKFLTLKVYYSIDQKGDSKPVDPEDPDSPKEPTGDNIPDKYQVTVEYVSANQTQGTVTGDVEKVITLYADDEDHSKGYVSEKAITPNTDDVTTTANTGYEANGWNPDPTQPLNVKGGQTYTYTAQWKAVEPSPSPSTTPSNPGGGNGGGGTDPTPAPRYTVNWEDGDGNIIKTATVTGTTVPDSLYPADPEKEGSSFLGWGEPDIVGNVITIIAEWEEEFDPNDVPLIVAPGLDSTDHFAYIIGYGDGTVRPTRNITRAEVATIFYRLMTDDYRGTFWCQTNDFTDVNSGDWFNNAVSTSAEAELVKGYADGTFKGKNNITRAEFATIAARFLSDDPTGENPFTDIGSHWAKNDILKAYEAGWINGYADGTFKPNALITRAEAMTIVNRMLNRVPHAEDLLPDEMTTYPDNQPGAWYYAAVQEATNSHDYEMGERDGETVETWTNMKPNRDWAALEKEWSDAYSGSNGNDVM